MIDIDSKDLEEPSSSTLRRSITVGKNVIIYENNDEDNADGHVDEYEQAMLYWNMKRTAEKPCACCCQLCGVWVFLFALLVLLSVTVASIAFDLGVPFYDRTEINQRREDSLYAIERDETFLSSFGQTGEVETCVHEDPTILTRNGTLLQGPMPSVGCQSTSNSFLRLVYVSQDRTSNALTAETLREIQKVEDHILNTLALTRYCYLLASAYGPFPNRNVSEWTRIVTESVDQPETYRACERINSPLNFLDDLYFDRLGNSGLGYYLIPNDQVQQEYDYESLDDVVSFWSKFGVESYDFSAYDFIVATVGSTVTIQNLFWSVTSSEFRNGSTQAVGLTSTFALGVPIHSYKSPTEDADTQFADTGVWLHSQFDSYLKSVNIPGIDVFWADSEGGMESEETGQLALASMSLFPFSLLIVLCYLIYMQDSFFIGLAGMAQIMLCFIPTFIVYRYVVGEDYIGVLNLIAIYIILGIGVDNIFVFSDQFYHQSGIDDFPLRMQTTFNVAGKAMFTTSCTTFISFISNASSAFPAVSTFGMFAAILVVMNFLAVMTYFPAVYAVYFTRVRHNRWDHPSQLFCGKKTKHAENSDDDENAEGKEDKEDKEEEKPVEPTAGADADAKKEDHEEEESALVAFFRDTWAPLVIRLRYAVVAFFLVVFVLAMVMTTRLEPDEEAPAVLPNGNNYKEYPQIIIDHFARAGNPRAIEVSWISGIDPDDPIDRTGTDPTDTEDYGVANYLDCSTFNPSTLAAQVWALKTCHDVFFGNVTDFHGGSDKFAAGGTHGPESRMIITDNVPMDEYNYYSKVSCPMQGFRDWALTDTGCTTLTSLGLPCYAETSAREGCTALDTEGNSCEPFPVPSELFVSAFSAFLLDPSIDPSTQQTSFDKYARQLFVGEKPDTSESTVVTGDFSCRTNSDQVLYAISTTASLDQDFAQNYEVGMELYGLWDDWSAQMRTNAPREMIGTMQVSNGAWAYYFLNETLISETFSGIALALGLSFLVLTLVSGNIIMAFYAVVTIGLIVVDVFGFTVLVGWKLGVIEAVNYVVVIGMSIDYAVHMSEAYTMAHGDTRTERVILMLEEMGVSVLSGALSTLLAIFLMFFAPNSFFVKFATFLFVTIALSCVYSMTFFPALLAIIGPVEKQGLIYHRLHVIRENFMHESAKRYIKSKAFMEREFAICQGDEETKKGDHHVAEE